MLTKPAWVFWAAVKVVAMTPAWLWSPVSLVYLITAVSALALFHQPAPCHWPVAGWYHFWRALIPVLAQLRKSGAAT